MGKFKEVYSITEDGYDARMQNRPLSDNPYTDEMKKYWEIGWTKADREIAKFDFDSSYAHMETL